MTLNVSEVFWSPQGEGARAGEMSAFIRLQGCSAKFACAASGVVCDTEFESGRALEAEALEQEVRALETPPPKWIVWTGGEPLDQLTPEVVAWFRSRGYRQALETSGVRSMTPEFKLLFDWITCSPKVAEHILLKHLGDGGVRFHHDLTGAMNVMAHVHELRYVRHMGQAAPKPSLAAMTYYLSPHSDGFTLNPANIRHVIQLCKQEPRWRISVQNHKLWSVL